MAQESDDPELQRLLREIAAEEAGHEATLRSRLRLYEEKHLLRDTISRYVSPEMCEEILKNPALLQLGGRRQEVTVLFADIKGFTAMSESLDPEEVVEVLNTYFTEMVDLVFKHQGTLDKYVGDALMAVFGVPMPLPHAATRAVECAVAMQRRLAQMQAQKRTPIKGVRIGINTGEAIVGNIGSDKRMDFTVIGDAVNVAARLQELGQGVGGRHPGERGHFPAGERAVRVHPRGAGGAAGPPGADGNLSIAVLAARHPQMKTCGGAGFPKKLLPRRPYAIKYKATICRRCLRGQPQVVAKPGAAKMVTVGAANNPVIPVSYGVSRAWSD